jgi:hypothetical protein
MSGFHHSSGLHHSFDKARASSPLKMQDHAIIGLHLLHSLLLANPRAWVVMERNPHITLDDTMEFYIDWFRRISQPDALSAEDAKQCLEDLNDKFTHGWTMLERNVERIPEPVLHTAQTGMLFTESVLSKKSNDATSPLFLYGENLSSPFMLRRMCCAMSI